MGRPRALRPKPARWASCRSGAGSGVPFSSSESLRRTLSRDNQSPLSRSEWLSPGRAPVCRREIMAVSNSRLSDSSQSARGSGPLGADSGLSSQSGSAATEQHQAPSLRHTDSNRMASPDGIGASTTGLSAMKTPLVNRVDAPERKSQRARAEAAKSCYAASQNVGAGNGTDTESGDHRLDRPNLAGAR